MDFLDLLSKEAVVYICRGFENYLGNNTYTVGWLYEKGSFVKCSKIIKPYSVFDKSVKTIFPNSNEKNVLNTSAFKALLSNKWEVYKTLTRYFPETLLVSNNNELMQVTNIFNSKDVLVVKPLDGMKGHGIGFFEGNDIEGIKCHIESYPGHNFILQRFIETSKGIKGITNRRHDLRLVCINNKVVWSHVRMPQGNELKANVAGGGNIEDVDLILLPKLALEIVEAISSVFSEKYNNPMFSVDFGFEDNKPYIFELNDQTIGFPRPEMKTKNRFLNELVIRLTA